MKALQQELPAPLVPKDCDLRGLPFMPLDVIRLLDSDLFALSTGDEFKTAVALWAKSWTQVPAASLPDDDKILAHLSSAGTRWKKVKAGAMRGWILCSDGRWYHPVVAEKALEALPMRQEYEQKRSAENDRKQRERKARQEMFDLLRANGVVPEWNTPTKQLRELAQQYLSREPDTLGAPSVTAPVTAPVTEEVTQQSQHVTAKTGTVKGTGTVIQKEKTSTPEPGVNPSPPGGGTETEISEIEAIDDKAIVFATGVPALERLGMPEKSAKGMVGKCVKEAGIDGAMRICGRLSVIERHPNPAALVVTLLQEERDPVFVGLREKFGECRKLPNGGYAAAGRTFDAHGQQEVCL